MEGIETCEVTHAPEIDSETAVAALLADCLIDSFCRPRQRERIREGPARGADT